MYNLVKVLRSASDKDRAIRLRNVSTRIANDKLVSSSPFRKYSLIKKHLTEDKKCGSAYNLMTRGMGLYENIEFDIMGRRDKPNRRFRKYLDSTSSRRVNVGQTYK